LLQALLQLLLQLQLSLLHLTLLKLGPKPAQIGMTSDYTSRGMGRIQYWFELMLELEVEYRVTEASRRGRCEGVALERVNKP